MFFGNLEIFTFFSPFIYNLMLYFTHFYYKNVEIIINTKNHNYNMAFQSCILLGITLYDYYIIASIHNISYYNFIQISHIGSSYHQQGHLSLIRNVYLVSKMWEWIDTILLIVNKKKVITLHWWHHSTITWAFYTGFYSSSNYTIGFLNNIIHIIMYLYYADVKMIKPYAKYLTSLQIVQLFSGVYMNYLSYYYNTEYKYRLFSIINGCLFFSYGIMFLQFFNTKYSTTKSKILTDIKPKFIRIEDYKYDITNFTHAESFAINIMTMNQEQNHTNVCKEFHIHSE